MKNYKFFKIQKVIFTTFLSFSPHSQTTTFFLSEMHVQCNFIFQILFFNLTLNIIFYFQKS